MGPRILVSDTEFLKIADQERGLIIRGPAIWKSRMHVMRSGDCYDYTVTKTELVLPEDCRVIESRQITP